LSPLDAQGKDVLLEIIELAVERLEMEQFEETRKGGTICMT
jgi:hypothetical protein